MITFLVVSGFSLFDIRKLYIDEMYEYYQELFYTLEKSGDVKEGTYAKIVKSTQGKAREAEAENTVSALRKQMFNSISKKNKKS